MPSAAIASPAASSVSATGHAPAFFVRACQKAAARPSSAELLVVPPQPKTIRSRRRVAILLDATRRGGLRAANVHEIERLEAFDASLVGEIRTGAEHYVPFARLAQTRAAASEKLRALLLSRPAAALERPEKMPVKTAPAAAA